MLGKIDTLGLETHMMEKLILKVVEQEQINDFFFI